MGKRLVEPSVVAVPPPHARSAPSSPPPLLRFEILATGRETYYDAVLELFPLLRIDHLIV